MLETELSCDSSGISPVIKARYKPKKSPEWGTKVDAFMLLR